MYWKVYWNKGNLLSSDSHSVIVIWSTRLHYEVTGCHHLYFSVVWLFMVLFVGSCFSFLFCHIDTFFCIYIYANVSCSLWAFVMVISQCHLLSNWQDIRLFSVHCNMVTYWQYAYIFINQIFYCLNLARSLKWIYKQIFV